MKLQLEQNSTAIKILHIRLWVEKRDEGCKPEIVNINKKSVKNKCPEKIQ